MKLKSKLIATIVSMCAAIAVMGVGVWASSSQTFQVTVKNDIDVKIISVDADVYGEFAVYSQFSGHTTYRQTNAYAQAYHHTRTLGSEAAANEAFQDRKDMDHGYLLYARGINGYNDATPGDTSYYENEKAWYDSNVIAAEGSGYYKYVTEAKDDVYFATAESEGVKNDTTATDMPNGSHDKPEDWAKSKYNIDFNTHTAQITYMYTIRQWKMASANAATNEIEFLLKSSISTDSDLDLGPANDDSANDLTTGLTNAAGTAGVYIDAFITNATADGDAEANNPAPGAANGVGALKTSYDWNRVSLVNGTRLPESTENETYYILITYTFARTGANLDLSGLANAVEHQLVMTPPGKLADTGIDYNDTIADYNTVNDPTTNGTVKLCYATGLNTSQSGYDSKTETVSNADDYAEYYGKGYQIFGLEFVPTFTPAQITSQITDKQLAACFANSEDDNPWLSNILGITEDDTDASKIARQGYIFATDGTQNTKGTGANCYIPITANGTTGYFVKTMNDGVTVPTNNAYHNNDSIKGDTN